jgi:hypothetical protein
VVWSFGGAKRFGSIPSTRLSSSVVSAAAVPGGGGYWLLTANGNLYAFGAAAHLGRPWMASHVGSFVGLASTADGNGLWVVSSGGTVLSYGDAPYCGSLTSPNLGQTVSGIVPTRDGKGYWLYTSSGQVYAFGDALSFGTAAPDGAALVGLVPTPDDNGYWLAYADGFVAAFGDALTYGSLSQRPSAPVVSIAGFGDGQGYWLTTSAGQVFGFGQAASYGSLSSPAAPSAPVVAIVAASGEGASKTAGSGTQGPLPAPVTPLKGDPFVHGTMGYDVSSYQCARSDRAVRQAKLPTSTALAIVQVAGWLNSATNPCLSSLLSWARSAATQHDPDSLYLFMNAPTNTPAALAQGALGPAGDCRRLASSEQLSCRAYNYGYNGALAALRYAASQGARMRLWWLDVEGSRAPSGPYATFSSGEYWAASKALNDETIQGALDALHKQKITVGIYSTSVQWADIAGGYVPSGPRLPLWVAGVPWTNPPYSERGLPSEAVLRAWCAGTAHYAGHTGTDLFAGGVPWLLQETPGPLPSPFGIDPDYAC